MERITELLVLYIPNRFHSEGFQKDFEYWPRRKDKGKHKEYRVILGLFMRKFSDILMVTYLSLVIFSPLPAHKAVTIVTYSIILSSKSRWR